MGGSALTSATTRLTPSNDAISTLGVSGGVSFSRAMLTTAVRAAAASGTPAAANLRCSSSPRMTIAGREGGAGAVGCLTLDRYHCPF